METTKISEPGRRVHWVIFRLRNTDLQMLKGFFGNPVHQWVAQIRSRTARIQAGERSVQGLHWQTQDGQNPGIPERHHCLCLAHRDLTLNSKDLNVLSVFLEFWESKLQQRAAFPGEAVVVYKSVPSCGPLAVSSMALPGAHWFGSFSVLLK